MRGNERPKKNSRPRPAARQRARPPDTGGGSDRMAVANRRTGRQNTDSRRPRAGGTAATSRLHPPWGFLPMTRRLALPVAALAALVAGPARADDIRALDAYPPKLLLKGGDDAPQLVITATLPSLRTADFTGEVRFEVAEPVV